MEAVTKAVNDLKEKVATANADKAKGEDEEERELLMTRQGALAEELKILKKELASCGKADPGEVERKVREVNGFKIEAERWTDNLMLVESYLNKLIGGDKEGMDGLRRECYGTEYVEGEGLAEL